MKKMLAFVMTALLLTGCGKTDSQIARGMALREKLLTGSGCGFETVITADFGTQTYTFTMACRTDGKGDLTFTVTQPETLSGISGSIGDRGGKLTFDDQALAFPLLADGEVSPVSAPWLLMKTLRGGYLKSCCIEGDLCRLTIDDSYEQDALQLDIWLDASDSPVGAEIVWQGRRILSMQVRNFTFL